MARKRNLSTVLLPLNLRKLIFLWVVALILVSKIVRRFSFKTKYESSSEEIFASNNGHFYPEPNSDQKICDRRIPFSESIPNVIGSLPMKNKIIVIGHDTMNQVQTNNHINAIFHAVDYSNDIGAYLVIFRNSWAERSLMTLFGESSLIVSLELWGIFLIQDMSELVYRFPHERYQVFLNKSFDMYYYHTSAPLHLKQERRHTILRYLWSHPSRGKNGSQTFRDMCSVAQTVLNPNESYMVIHSRWMTNNGCLGRMGSFAARLKTLRSDQIPYGIELDRKAPCLLSPSYIKNIIRTNNFDGKRIFIITDGKNPGIVQSLKEDKDIGPYVTTIPRSLSWVGGDMMLAVLADLFVGSPISTLAGNVARARVALGFNATTNYLFPRKKESEKVDSWEFFCDDRCLYDPSIMKSYVG